MFTTHKRPHSSTTTLGRPGQIVSRIAAVFCTLLALSPPAALAGDEEAVLEVVDTLFTAMRKKDGVQLRSTFLPEARLGTAKVDAWIEQVVGSSAYLDEVTYDETVLIDGDLAVAWTPYTLYVDGQLHHCGVDSFVMQHNDEGWKILQLNDTRRLEQCPDPGGSDT